MIRNACIQDIEEISQLIYHKNQNIETQSSYMSKTYENIYKDLLSTIHENSKLILVSLNQQKMDGVIVAFYNHHLQAYDIAGPYTIQDDLSLAKELLQSWMNQFDSKLNLNFFFNEKSLCFKQLMDVFSAQFNQNEYILTLDKTNFMDNPPRLDVNFMGRGHQAKTKIAFDEIFPNIYLSSDEIIQFKENQRVIVLEHQDDIAGLAFFKINQKKCSLECFGLRIPYRNRRLSNPFLHAALHLLFQTIDINHVKLVVDQINDKAIKTYLNLGFHLEQVNLSYSLSR
jgi:hypothetical protein